MSFAKAMKGFRAALIVAALSLSVLLATASQQPAAAAGTASISGRVTGLSNSPLEDVSVQAVRVLGEWEWDWVDSASTDSDGRYTITGLEAGTYLVRFYAPEGYVDEYWDGAYEIQDATKISLGAGASRTGVDASLNRGARISGRVTDSAGVPLKGQTVIAVKRTLNGWQWGSGQTQETDADGRYVIDGLPPGTYTIEFSGDDSLIQEYWDDATSLESATTFQLASGQSRSGFDASLARGAKITGRLTKATGGAAAEVSIVAERQTADGWRWDRNTRSAANGTYVLGGLRPGTYRLLFQGSQTTAREYWNNKYSPASASRITVSAGQTRAGVDAELAQPASISGRVTDASGNPIDRAWLYVERCDTVGGSWEFVQSGDTGSAGTYTITGLSPGRYRVRFGGTQNHVGEYWDNALSSQKAKTVVLTTGQRRTGIDAVLAGAGRISGRVTDSAGSPIAGVWVEADRILVSTTGQWWGSGAVTDSNGEYTIGGLVQGNYRVRFRPSGAESSQAYASEFWDNRLERAAAVPVAVVVGQTRSGVNAQLARGASISGRATMADGSPAREVNVIAWMRTAAGGWEWATSAQTNATGEYVLRGLPAATYRVEFSSGRDVFGEYWKSTRVADEARSIKLAEGQQVTSIDGRMRKRVRASLSTPAVSVRARTVTVSGLLKPAHAANVTISVYRGTGCDITLVKSVVVKSGTSGAYRKAITLGRGTYRFVTSHSDAAHAWVSSKASRVVVVK